MFDVIKEHVDIVFLNEGIRCLVEEHLKVLDMSNGEVVVVKLGGAGSMGYRGDERTTVGVYSANLTDTTGAGTHTHRFLYGYINDCHC